MPKRSHLELSRRERQIMEIIYTRGTASAADVLEAMPDPPSYSAVRAMLSLLEEKGHLKHKKSGKKYIYQPTVHASKARRFAVRNLLNTFFENSVEQAVASMLDLQGKHLTPEDYDRLAGLIKKAREEGKAK